MILKHKHLTIEFSKSVNQVFNDFMQTGNRKEKGGILLGEICKNEISIIKASVPTIFDKSTRFSFNRNKKSAQIIVDYEFFNSQGKTIYLGEWHTHPEDYPTPSSTDIKMIRQQFNKNLLNEDFLLLVIVGRKSIYVSIFNGKENIPLTE